MGQNVANEGHLIFLNNGRDLEKVWGTEPNLRVAHYMQSTTLNIKTNYFMTI